MLIDKMKEKIEREFEFWKRHPGFKKSGIAILTYKLITLSEIEDLQYLSIDWIARTLKGFRKPSIIRIPMPGLRLLRLANQ